jgi:hypothetical protein
MEIHTIAHFLRYTFQIVILNYQPYSKVWTCRCYPQIGLLDRLDFGKKG